MPILPYETRKAASGYDSTNEVSLLPPNRAVLIRNFVFDRAGKLRGSLSHTFVENFPAGVDGMFHYQGNEAEDDRLLVVSGGVLYASPLDNISFMAVDSGFLTGAQVRAAAFDDELFFAQEGGITPLRFNGESLFQLGIDAPAAAPTAIAGTPANSAAAKKIGNISYRYRFFDEKFRESEPSPSVTVAFGSPATLAGQITLFSSWADVDPQVQGAYLEATVSGASVYYRIATLERSEGEVFYEDNALDTIVQGGTVSTKIGRRSVPNKASCICSHKNYLWMNDTESPRQLQISSLNAPTYFSTITEIPASDGGRMTIPGARGGNPIVQLAQFGSLLMVWLKKGVVQIWGETLASFKPRELHVRGTVAPGSAIRVDNGLWFLLDASIYNLDYQGTFLSNKVSQETDADLRAHTIAERRDALATFAGNRYCLSVGDTLYVYDFTAQGWGQVRIDTSVAALAENAGLYAAAAQAETKASGTGGRGSGGGLVGQADATVTNPVPV